MSVHVNKVMDAMRGKLKHWDSCRCGMLVGKAQFYKAGTSPDDFQKFNCGSKVFHVVLPAGADAKAIQNLIEMAINGAGYCDPNGVVHRANMAQYASQDDMSRGFFLFLSKVDKPCNCSCN